MLPDAVEREREVMLEDSMALLRGRGYERFEALALPGCAEPRPLTIPVLNVRMRPDVYATGAELPPFLALVEASSDLGEESGGRRWQALADWARRHGAASQVYVHPEDRGRAADIARHWHLDEATLNCRPAPPPLRPRRYRR